jgi:hypothetical protein
MALITEDEKEVLEMVKFWLIMGFSKKEIKNLINFHFPLSNFPMTYFEWLKKNEKH